MAAARRSLSVVSGAHLRSSTGGVDDAPSHPAGSLVAAPVRLEQLVGSRSRRSSVSSAARSAGRHGSRWSLPAGLSSSTSPVWYASTTAWTRSRRLELLEDVRDVRLDGRLADVELLPDLRVREAAAIRRKTSRSRSLSSSSSFGRRGAWHARELLDHALRDRRREQRVSGGDRADRGEELLGRVVLEDEAARARRCSAS